jgi:hypothetical protein
VAPWGIAICFHAGTPASPFWVQAHRVFVELSYATLPAAAAVHAMGIQALGTHL